MRKKIPTLTIITLLLLSPVSAFAVDLPIDIETIGRQDEDRQYAITVLHEIDLFSETSQAQSEMLAGQHERERVAAELSVFTEPHTLYVAEPNETLLRAAIEYQLFSEPLQRRSFTLVEEDPGISLWVTIPIFIFAAILGLIIAIKTTARKKEREANVHHHHS